MDYEPTPNQISTQPPTQPKLINSKPKSKIKLWLIIVVLAIVISGLVAVLILFLNKKPPIADQALTVKSDLIVAQQSINNKLQNQDLPLDKPQIIVNPYKISPLSAIIMFETKEEVTAKISISTKSNCQNKIDFNYPKNKRHRLPIYGLFADQDNVITVDFGSQHFSLNVKTDPLPNYIVKPTVAEDKKACVDNNDFIFTTPSANGVKMTAYDKNYNVRWYLTERFIWDNKLLKNGHLLLGSGDLAHAPYYSKSIFEIDMLGKIYHEYKIPGGYHHDFFELKNGNLLVATNDLSTGDGTVEDVIVEINRQTGEVAHSIDLKQLLPQKEGKSGDWTAYDWFHNNSVWYDEKTDAIILSGRHQDAIVSISRDHNAQIGWKINYIVGDPTNWGQDMQKYFLKPPENICPTDQPEKSNCQQFEWQWMQHAAMILPNGDLFVFDNGVNRSKDKKKFLPAEQNYSRGVIYRLDLTNRTIRQIWQYGKDRGSNYYSPYISDVDYLADNHYLITSGGIGFKNGKVVNQPAPLVKADKLNAYISEIKNGKLAYELKLPTNIYRAEIITPTADLNFNFNNAKRLGSLAKTDLVKINLKIKNIKPLSDIKDAHEIKLSREEDRLRIDGRFKKEQKINLYLINNKNEAFKYQIRVARRNYTAMCVDVLNDDEKANGLKTVDFINQKGLNGKYGIVFEIDGQLYQADHYVEF